MTDEEWIEAEQRFRGAARNFQYWCDQRGETFKDAADDVIDQVDCE
jgi:hypothetical protein